MSDSNPKISEWQEVWGIINPLERQAREMNCLAGQERIDIEAIGWACYKYGPCPECEHKKHKDV